MRIAELRNEYHNRICMEIIRVSRDASKGIEYPNFADSNNRSSVNIAGGIAERIGYKPNYERIKEQRVGVLFESATKDFLSAAFELLKHIRPGRWTYSTDQTTISRFDQYEHLAYLADMVARDKALAPALGGDYIVKPDIVVARLPLSDTEINGKAKLVGKREAVAKLTPLRSANRERPCAILHASVSCK